MSFAVILGAGAAIGLFDAINSQGQRLQETTTILNSMSVTSNFEEDTLCYNSVSGNEVVSIQPGPTSPTYDPSLLQAADGACTICQSVLSAIQQAREELELDALETSNGRYSPQTASQPFLDLMAGGLTPSADVNSLGPCDLMCRDVVVYGISQSQSFATQENCQVTAQVENDISQSINGKIQAQLKNTEDFLGQLSDAFSSNSESISASLSNVMNQNIVTSVRQSLQLSAFSTQQFSVGGLSQNDNQSHSMFVNLVQQSFNANSVATLESTTNLTNSLRMSAQFSIAQSLTNRNASLEDLANDFLGVINTMGQFLDTTSGDLLLILGLILLILLISLASFYFFTQRGKQFGDNVINAAESRATSQISGGPKFSKTKK